jgi:predicted metal-dependent hydrolase
MIRLLGWHAVEEIEHKAVAFDVLKRVDPSYWLRVAGLAYATLQLGRYWAVGARVLWKQDGMTVRDALRQLRAVNGEGNLIRNVFGRGIREYLRRDFHPDDNDNYEMAQAWLEKLTATVAA